MTHPVKIKLLETKDIPSIMSAFLGSEWNTPKSYFKGLWEMQDKGEIEFLLARVEKDIAGFVYIKWKSDYRPFAEKNIPEIRDLRVLKQFRRRGAAAALMDEAEKRVFRNSPAAGIGVGLYADYGAAQRMYVKRGYVPDGRGLMYNNQAVQPGLDVFVDDNLALYFTKESK